MTHRDTTSANDGQSRLTVGLGTDLSIPDFLRNKKNLVAEKDAEIKRLRDALEEIANGVYAAPERLREIAALALKGPNARRTKC